MLPSIAWANSHTPPFFFFPSTGDSTPSFPHHPLSRCCHSFCLCRLTQLTPACRPIYQRPDWPTSCSDLRRRLADRRPCWHGSAVNFRRGRHYSPGDDQCRSPEGRPLRTRTQTPSSYPISLFPLTSPAVRQNTSTPEEWVLSTSNVEFKINCIVTDTWNWSMFMGFKMRCCGITEMIYTNWQRPNSHTPFCLCRLTQFNSIQS